MPQKTNFNVSPYFDDFDPNKNYKRVLFKPGTTVQARELTTLQSILQNQIENFANSSFKNGDKVIPGNLAFVSSYDAILVDSTFNGLTVSEYGSKLINRKITGRTSGVTAKVINYITSEESTLGIDTFYIKYLSPSTIDNSTKEFLEDEDLILSSGSDIKFGNNTIRLNNSFANTTSLNASRSGSAAILDKGVYYIRGFFVDVPKQSIILDQYSNTPTYRVGLLIDEQILTAYDDPSLFDNARGYSNFSAPGADRFQITATLHKKSVDDFDDENFIELMRVVGGKIQNKPVDKKEENNELKKELARRTYDESGDYVVSPFRVSARETVDNYINNNGLYDEGQLTSNGNIASEDLFTIRVSPGKAYVRGYEVDKKIDTYIDASKPRTTKTVTNANYTFKMGNRLVVNNVYGTPIVGLGTTAYISLRDSRNHTVGVSTGSEIGQARIYDFKIGEKQDSHSDQSTNYDSYFVDIHTYTKLTTETKVSVSVPCLIEGASSGAKGYLAFTVSSGNTLTLSDVSGTFLRNERLIFDEAETGQIKDKSTVVSSVTDYRISDVHSLEAYDSSSVIFTSDLVLDQISYPDSNSATYTISASSSGISTVTSTKLRFSTDKIRLGDIVSYNKIGESLPTYNVVNSITNNGSAITIRPVSSVSNVCVGTLPASQISVSDFKILRSSVKDKDLADLLSPLPNNFISNVDLSNAELIIRKQYNVTVSSNSVSVTETDPNLFFEPYTSAETYMLFDTSGGQVEKITSGKVSISGDSKTLTISGITSVTGGARLSATLSKINVKSKKVDLRKCGELIVNGTVKKTAFNGLSPKTAFGTRVEDDTISLNYPDVLRVHAIYESNDSNDPTLPSINLVQISSDISALSKGEVVFGNTSKCKALVVSTSGSDKVNLVIKNNKSFVIGETVTFLTSKIVANVSKFDSGDKNIINSYSFNNGQKDDYCDYSRITRKVKQQIPQRRILVIFDRYRINANEPGDFITVNSYSPDDYSEDLPTIKKYKASDWLDFRPRVKPFTGQTYSPFQFESRDFGAEQSTIPNVLISNKKIRLSYSYYLGRVDKLTLNQKGQFELLSGEPSEVLIEPAGIRNNMEVATIYLPPYLYSVNDVRITFPSYRRYTMEDIGRLEDRIKNLEYYTQLSLLELETSTLTVKDETTGLDRFKSGFFVDNFKSHAAHEIKTLKASIDLEKGLLRPSHYTTGVDLLLGSDILSDPNEDKKNRNGLLSENIRKTGDLVTLDYSETLALESKFATQSIEINPFDVENWIGSIDLNPSSDLWIDEKQVSASEPDMKFDYSVLIDIYQDDPDIGFVPIDWNSWVIYHTGIPYTLSTKSNKEVNNITFGSQVEAVESPVQSTDLDVYKLNSVDTRDGVQYNIAPGKYDVKTANKIINETLIKYMRSRNIEFDAVRLKPFTQFYAFFSGKDITRFCIPKLVEVEMISGVFQMGESVYGQAVDDERDRIAENDATVRFRLADPRHKQGPYYKPTLNYTKNPYNSGGQEALPTKYTTNTTILNVDTGSLGLASETRFFGWVEKGMILHGEKSGAKCKITNVRLVSDVLGSLIGSFYIPNYTKNSGNPRFTTGTKIFRLTTSQRNLETDRKAVSSIAEALFESRGVLDTSTDGVNSIRKSIFVKTSITDDKILSSDDESDNLTGNLEKILTRQPEPLAQTFKVVEENGIFVSKIDLFFKAKPLDAVTNAQRKSDDDESDDKQTPVTVQIRTVENGIPTKKVVPFSEVSKTPFNVSVSNNGTVATTFTFESPVYLQGSGTQYAIVLITSDNSYEVFISKDGDDDLTNSRVNKVKSSKQPEIISLFKSKLGGFWEATKSLDLKFKLYKCQFVNTPGTVTIYNSQLNYENNGTKVSRVNPLLMLSRQSNFNFKDPITNSGILTSGVSIRQDNSNATGRVVTISGSVGVGTTSLTYNTTTGIGLTPSSGVATYYNVSFVSLPELQRGLPLTQLGNGLVGDITVTDGLVSLVNVSIGGTSYNVGDVVTANIGSSDKLKFTVGIVTAVNSILVENIQGDWNQNDYIRVVNSDGSTVGFGTTNNMTSDPDQETERIRRGLFFRVFKKNHGMHARNNRVELKGVASDSPVSQLTQSVSDTSLSPIYVDNVGIFTSFEGVNVSATNPGFITIGSEIIKYTGYNLAQNTLTIVERGVKDGFDVSTRTNSYSIGSKVRKYELSGVSLFRINTTHDFAAVDVGEEDIEKSDITLDSFYLKIDRAAGTNKTNREFGSPLGTLYIADSKIAGGNNVQLSKNIQYETLTPMIEYFKPNRTNINARARTISGTSAGSQNQISFIDEGFDPIILNESNNYPTPRLIASIPNENLHLRAPATPGRRSLTVELVMNTSDPDVSPVIDSDRMFAITSTNRINNPYNDDDLIYLDGHKVKTDNEDEHDCVYITKIISLENPATSLKAQLTGFRPSGTNFRVFYKVFRSDSTNKFQTWFGFNGSGTPDRDPGVAAAQDQNSKVLRDYDEYSYSVVDLPDFDAFQIKIVMISSNQASVPLIKDLRVLALA